MTHSRHEADRLQGRQKAPAVVLTWSAGGALVLALLAASAASPQVPPPAPSVPRQGTEIQDLVRLRPLPTVARLPSASQTPPRARPPLSELRAQLHAALAPAMPVAAAATSRLRLETEADLATALRERLGRDVEVGVHRPTGAIRSLEGAALHPAFPEPVEGLSRAAATALSFLVTHRDLLGLESPEQELAVVAEQDKGSGELRVRMQQRFHGLDVWSHEADVHLAADGSVELFQGTYIPTPRRLVTTPVVSIERALQQARREVAGAPDEGRVLGSALVVYADEDRPARLAWKVEVERSLVDAWTVFVDAMQGVVLGKVSLVHSEAVVGSGTDLLGITRPLNVWREGSVFIMSNTSKPMFQGPPFRLLDTPGVMSVVDHAFGAFGPVLFAITSTNANAWPFPDAVSASFNGSLVYNYYFAQHGRNSFDGNGSRLDSLVRAVLPDCPAHCPNAWWRTDQALMSYGTYDRYAASLDIVGHEISHGVVATSAGLVYSFESGALNEAFSDFFGEMVEAWVHGSNDWIVGTELVEPIRSMHSPSSFSPSQPAHFDQYRYLTFEQDNGGVHINSGIINRAFYLLTAGFPNSVGRSAAERIAYRALTTYLRRRSDFEDARFSLIRSAEDLFGVSSGQVRAVAEAFDAVGIFGAQPTQPPPPTPTVTGPDAVLFTFWDTQSQRHLVGRRDPSFGDDPAGVFLSNRTATLSRVPVTGDGTFALFVDGQHDVCFLDTSDGSDDCLGFPGLIHSVAMSRSGLQYAFVLRDSSGQASNRISYFDGATGTSYSYELTTTAPDAPSSPPVLLADWMDFTSDGRYLVYDALSVLELEGGAIGVWSLFALELETGFVFQLTNPTVGLETYFPSVGKTSDRYLSFELYDVAANTTIVAAGDVHLGTSSAVANFVGGPAAPSYTGDDRAIVFSAPDNTVPTGGSLWRSPLAADRLTPIGDPQLYLSDGVYGTVYRRGTFRPPSTACGDGPAELCVGGGGRFEVDVFWQSTDGKAGGGRPVALTGDTGYFWFFDDSNVEVVVKVLDACPINGRFWVFATGLTDVEALVRVRDTVTGTFKSYHNPLGRPFEPILDTNAFAACAYSKSTLAPHDAPRVEHALSAVDLGAAASWRPRPRYPVPAPSAAETGSSACDSNRYLCLGNDRFEVDVAFRTSGGATGNGKPIRLTDDTGYFWFFDSSNVEIVLKVLAACPINGQFWVFAGGLTDVQAEITVRDTLTGRVASYFNPLGTGFRPIQDTAALPCQ